MPISTPKTFICPKCGYKLTKTTGDVIAPSSFPTCPKCKTKMTLKG